ncbi:MAG TPA: alpha/beta hydrolase [Anaerolineae bacterium]|nr:alpha/beta hydrolase [Anaerolineae bacterium]HIQ12328.1 alpha/beta hydrolase [Caldilineales bacterium]
MKRALVRKLLGAYFLASALASVILHLHPQRVLARLLIWGPKILAATFTPALMLVNLASLGLGLIRRNKLWMATGAAGSLLSGHYIYQIRKASPAFDRYFGDDWEDRVPPDLRPGFPPRRWSMLLRAPLDAPREFDVAVGRSPATGKAILANIWLPPADVAPNGAALIYVHGGAWVYGDKDNTPRPTFRHAAGQGYLVLDVAYTLWPESDIPSMVKEVKMAVLWLKAHAARYGIDPDRITLVGASAGAHLALLAAYAVGHPAFAPPGAPADADARVRAVAAYYPPVDFRAMYEDLEAQFSGVLYNRHAVAAANRALDALKKIGYAPPSYRLGDDLNIIRQMLGGSPDEVPAVYDLLSPFTYVSPDNPPTLFFQGADDFFPFAPPLRQLHRQLQRAGVVSIYIEFPYTPHGFDLFLPQISPVALRSILELDRFLYLVNFQHSIVS